MVSTGGNSGGGKTLKELMAAATTLQSIAVQSIKVGRIIKRISKSTSLWLFHAVWDVDDNDGKSDDLVILIDKDVDVNQSDDK